MTPESHTTKEFSGINTSLKGIWPMDSKQHVYLYILLVSPPHPPNVSLYIHPPSPHSRLPCGITDSIYKTRSFYCGQTINYSLNLLPQWQKPLCLHLGKTKKSFTSEFFISPNSADHEEPHTCASLLSSDPLTIPPIKPLTNHHSCHAPFTNYFREVVRFINSYITEQTDLWEGEGSKISKSLLGYA